MTVALKVAEVEPCVQTHDAFPLLDISFWFNVKLTVWLPDVILPTVEPHTGDGGELHPPTGDPS